MKAVEELMGIMKQLRDPTSGCPWDMKQTINTIAPYTLEEAYEVVEAIEKNDLGSLQDELGDLLFHIIFYSEMASEKGAFDFNSVAQNAADKLRRRHPHVFAGEGPETDFEPGASWEELKRKERSGNRDEEGEYQRLLGDIGASLPALLRAEKLQKRAASVGFDWPDVAPVLNKIREELDELGAEIEKSTDQQALEEEAGDVLFSCINLIRHLDISAETALRAANRKFEKRFAYIEARLMSKNRRVEESDLEELEALWQEAKTQEGA